MAAGLLDMRLRPRRHGSWGGKSRRWFWALSLVLLAIDLLFLVVNYLGMRDQFDTSMHEQARQQHLAYRLALAMEFDNMQKMASLVATDRRIQDLFLLGRQAVEREGGAGGGSEAARYRAELMAQVDAFWQRMYEDFGLRQLHFHIGPGSLSFLRVHKPEKFGDRMDDLRHIIVDTNRDGQPRTGFETGRIYSGLRGVVPLWARDPRTQASVPVGAVEVGTSFDHLFAIMDRHLHSGIAALLRRRHVADKMWQEQIHATFEMTSDHCQCLVDSSSRPEIETLLSHHGALPPFAGQPYLLRFVEWPDRLLAVTHLPLFDYLAERDGHTEPVGRILLWREVSGERAVFLRGLRNTLLYAIFGFFLVELLLYASIGLITGRLQDEIDRQTRELLTLKERAEAADRAKSAFLTNLSHELRTPMNTITGLSWAALQADLPPPERHARLAKVYEASQQLIGFIDELVDFSRLDQDPQAPVLRCEDFSLGALLAGLRDRHAAAAVRKGLTLTVEALAETPERLRGDASRLDQILGHLLDNAIKFTARGSISLKAEPGQPSVDRLWVQFTVVDTGIGLESEAVSRLSQPFFQSQDLASRHHGGIGLGLTISGRLLRWMGGRLEVESAPGKGACFRLAIPFARGTTPGTPCAVPARSPSIAVLACADGRTLAPLLRELRPLLQEQDPEVLNRIPQLAPFIALAEGSPVLGEFQSALEALAFDRALELLELLEEKAGDSVVCARAHSVASLPERGMRDPTNTVL